MATIPLATRRCQSRLGQNLSFGRTGPTCEQSLSFVGGKHERRLIFIRPDRSTSLFSPICERFTTMLLSGWRGWLTRLASQVLSPAATRRPRRKGIAQQRQTSPISRAAESLETKVLLSNVTIANINEGQNIVISFPANTYINRVEFRHPPWQWFDLRCCTPWFCDCLRD